MTSFVPVGSAIDLENCEREPIHIPGTIQPHGVLLTAAGPDEPVLQVSANARDLLGRDPEAVLGTRLSDLVHPDDRDRLGEAMSVAAGDRSSTTVRIDGTIREVMVHRSGEVWIVEVDEAGDEAQAVNTLGEVRNAVTELAAASSIAEMLDGASRRFRQITGFDRVMVYRFDREWNGQVVAEDKRADLDSFRGLHYPAADIPPQARALYGVNWLRFIRDVDAMPAPLVPSEDPVSGGPLDLSLAALRSVSPIHCEYLRNMEVTASMSVSLIIGGELAGLVACHHYSGPYVPTARQRATAEFLARTLSLMLEGRQQDERTRRMRATQDVLGVLSQAVSRDHDVGAALEQVAPQLLSVMDAAGVAWTFEGRTRTSGSVPDEDGVTRVRQWGLSRPGDEVAVHTDRLGLVEPSLADLAGTASGVLMLRIAAGQDVIFFRPEAVQTIDWGGNPHLKALQVDAEGAARLSPRASFALWRETVRQRSAEWEEAEIESSVELGTRLMQLLYNQQRTATLVAETLQRSLLPDQLPAPAGWQVEARTRTDIGEVGGDWYDAVELPDGSVVVVVGDVAGHGLDAASTMGQLRNSLRAYVVEDDDPFAVVWRLNRLTDTLAPQAFATVLVARIEPASGEVQLASAGHPAPLLRRGDVVTPVAMEVMPPLGAGLFGDGAQAASVRLTLAPGETMFLVSDGLFERRDESIDDSLTSLAGLIARLCRTEDDLPAVIAELVQQGPGHDIEDDVTVLAVHRE